MVSLSVTSVHRLPFFAKGKSGDDWVFIGGDSAGCPRDGWIQIDQLNGLMKVADWEAIKAGLPDLDAGEDVADYAASKGRVMRVSLSCWRIVRLCGAGVLYDVTIPDLSYTDVDGNVCRSWAIRCWNLARRVC